MKRSFISFLFTAFTLTAFGQIRGDQGDFFIDFGPKVMVGQNSLYNSKASFDSDRYLHHPSSVGYGGGFKVAFNFNRHIAIVGEGIYYKFNQVYGMSDEAPVSGEERNYKKQISYSVFEIPMMVRYNNDEMDYWELGYVHSQVLGISETNKGDGPDIPDDVDVQDLYGSKYGGAVLGFGGYVFGSGNFGISTGLRLRYDFDDFVTDGASIVNSPVYAFDAERKGSTNPLSLNLVVEFNYDLGFKMANSGCGHRKLILGN